MYQILYCRILSLSPLILKYKMMCTIPFRRRSEAHQQSIEEMGISFIQVATRQLTYHLPDGLYENPSEIWLQEAQAVRKRNLFGENDFGVSIRHHSGIIMSNINKTTTWLNI